MIPLAPWLLNLNPGGCKEKGGSIFRDWFGGRIRGGDWATMRSKVWAWSWVAINQFWSFWRLCGYHGRVGSCGIAREDVKIICEDIWRLRGLIEFLRIMRPAAWWLRWWGQIMDSTWDIGWNRAYETQPASLRSSHYGRFGLGSCRVVVPRRWVLTMPWWLAVRGYRRPHWLRTDVHGGLGNCTIACWRRMWFSTSDLGWVRMVQVNYAQLRSNVGWGLVKRVNSNQSGRRQLKDSVLEKKTDIGEGTLSIIV